MPERNQIGQRANPRVVIGVAGAFFLGVLGTATVMSQKSRMPLPLEEKAKGGETSKPKESEESKDGAATKDEGQETGGASGPIKLSEEGEQNAAIKVTPARYDSLEEGLTVPGKVEVVPDRTATITPPVAGKVVRILVGPGDAVSAREAIAVLDSPEIAQAKAGVVRTVSDIAGAKAQVEMAQAGIEQAQTRLESAASALRRQRELAQTGAFSQPSLQTAQNELTDAESELAQAETALRAVVTVRERTEKLFKEELTSRAELEASLLEERQGGVRLGRAQKRIATAQEALVREQKVFSGGLLSKQAVQNSEAEVRAAEGGVAQARKQEQAARISLRGAESALSAARSSLQALEAGGHTEGPTGQITLYAPISGVVTERRATLGQAVERSSELLTIQSLQTVMVIASLPEKDASRARVGSSVEVTVAAYPNARFHGVVQSIGGSVDEKTRTLPVRCLVQNQNAVLRPEMFAKVVLATGTKRKALVVPESAVDNDGDKRFVYVRTKDGYEKREVKVGRAFGKMVEIATGVKPGDLVVTQGLFTLKSESKKGELKGDED